MSNVFFVDHEDETEMAAVATQMQKNIKSFTALCKRDPAAALKEALDISWRLHKAECSKCKEVWRNKNAKG